jgi:hypothetical protein
MSCCESLSPPFWFAIFPGLFLADEFIGHEGDAHAPTGTDPEMCAELAHCQLLVVNLDDGLTSGPVSDGATQDLAA